MLRLESTPLFVALAVCLVGAGCSTASKDTRSQLVDVPIASTHADVTFTLTTTSWNDVLCAIDDERCATPEARAERFEQQVKRVAGRLQEGARKLYPDLEQRMPNVAGGSFDVYVVEAEDPGSAVSANGRIALNSAFAAAEPTDEWLAFVIARDMSHVIARHPEENSLLSIVTSVILNVAIPGSGVLKTVITSAGSVLAARSKRNSQATEADAMALKLLKAAGYRLHEVARSLQAASPVLHDNDWARNFRKSSGNFVAEVGRSEPEPRLELAGNRLKHKLALSAAAEHPLATPRKSRASADSERAAILNPESR